MTDSKSVEGAGLTIHDSEQSTRGHQFSAEMEAMLLENGFRIFTVTADDVSKLKSHLNQRNQLVRATEERKSGYSSWTGLYFNEGLPLESVVEGAQFALNPEDPFIKDSNRKTYEEQRKLVEDFSNALADKVKGIRAIIAPAAVYTYLDLIYEETTGRKLFDRKSTVSSTPNKSGAAIVTVGRDQYNFKFKVASQNKKARSPHIFVSPVIVPADFSPTPISSPQIT